MSRVSRALFSRVLLLLLLLPLVVQAQSWLASVPDQGNSEFLDAEDVFRVETTINEGGRIALRGRIAPGYYLYRQQLKLVANDKNLPLTLPHGKEKVDEFFGRTEVYYGDVGMEADVGNTTSATLHWQGCAEGGICYPPQTLLINIPPAPKAAAIKAAVIPATSSAVVEAKAGTLKPATESPAQPESPNTAEKSVETDEAASVTEGNDEPEIAVAQAAIPATAGGEDQQFASRLADSSLMVSLAVFFGMGLLLAFTPCVLPMIPIVSGLIIGGQPSTRRAMALSLAYVLPMALTYAAIGVIAGLAGANLQAALQNPWLLGSFAAIFVVLSLAMFGAFELRLPARLSNWLDSAGRHQRGGTLAGAAVLGVLSALLVGPCMTAPLAGALLYIAQSGSPVTGGLALFALGLGMGLPLLLIAVLGARALPKPGVWMDRVKAVFGYILLALAISMISRLLTSGAVLLLWGAWVLAIAVGFAAMSAPAGSSLLRQWVPRYFAAASAIAAVILVIGGATGGTDPMRPLSGFSAGSANQSPKAPGATYVHVKTVEDVQSKIAEAGAQGRWTLIDFYADWCVSCHVIERNVFGDAQVSQTLAGMQVLRPDITQYDAEDKALMRAWQVAGPPTLLLIDPQGRERREERTVGEIDASRFLQRLQRLQIVSE